MADLNLFQNNNALLHLIDFIKRNGKRKVFHKKDFFVHSGEYHDEVAYILRGSFKYFFYDYRNKEQIISFSFEHELIACYFPFRFGLNAWFNVQAMEDSVVMVISLKDLIQEIQTMKDGNMYMLSCVECLAVDLVQKNISFRRDSPEHRYMSLLKRIPNILYRVSIKEIASYIGVTPETLSRIRTRQLYK